MKNDNSSGYIILITEGESGPMIASNLRKSQDADVVEVQYGMDFKKISDRSYILIPTEDGYAELFENLGPPNCIIFYQTSTFRNTSWNSKRIKEELDKTFYSSMNLTKAIINTKITGKIKWIHAYSGYSLEAMASSFHLAMGALFKTIRIEYPKIVGQTIVFNDVEPAILNTVKKHTRILVDHIKTKGSRDSVEVCYSMGIKQERKLQRVNKSAFSVKKDSAKLRDDGVYIIAGGLGGIGKTIAMYLANILKNPVLILLGTSKLNGEKKMSLEALEAKGANVQYYKTDITLEHEVVGLITTVKKRFQNINGVIHSAGVLRDSFIVKKSIEDSEEVIAPKVYGTLFLDQYTQREPLDFFMLFSSISGVLGNSGQADYAYANSFLNCFSEHRTILRQKGERFGKTVAISWPLWEEGGMQVDKSQLKNMKEVLGMSPISNKEGIDVFKMALKSNVSQIMITKGDSRKIAKLTDQVGAIGPKESRQLLRKEESKKEVLNIRVKVKEYLKALISEVTELGLHKIKETVTFDKFGVDSFTIMKLNNSLEESFGELSKTLFFEYQTINELTDFFLENHRDDLIDKLGLKSEQSNEFKEVYNDTSIAEEELTPTDKKNIEFKKFHNNLEGVKKENGIAIVGMHGRFPKSKDLKEFWNNIRKGKNCITEIPSERWISDEGFYNVNKEEPGKSYTKWGGFIKDVDKFDPLFFNISPREAELMDPQERLLLETIWATIEDAGYVRQTLGKDVGVFVGSMYKHYPLTAQGTQEHALLSSTSYWSLVNRISYFFNFQGPSIAIDTACASSLTAVYMACNSIWRGECEVAFAGGVNLSLHSDKYVGLSATGMVSSNHVSQSFGEGDGYVPGEGVGAVMLKPLQKAIEDNDNIYGVVKSVNTNHSGKTSSFSVPGLKALENLLVRTVKDADVPIESITYLESAANGSLFGDAIEVNAIKKAFGQLTNKKGFCALGTVKSNIGHLEAASGISQLIKVLLQLKYKKIAPTINAERMNPNISLKDSPFYLQKGLTDWKCLESTDEYGEIVKIPRRAAINSFGAGGSNVHLVLEEHRTEDAERSENGIPLIIVLSAQRSKAMRLKAKMLLGYLKVEKKVSLKDIAYTLMCGRETLEYRLAMVVQNKKELKAKLKAFIVGKDLDSVYSGEVDEDAEGLDVMTSDTLTSLIVSNSYDEIAKSWIRGTSFDYHLLDQNKGGRKLSLPTYPFAKKRFWIGDDLQNAKTKPSVIEDKEHKEVKIRIRELLCDLLKISESEIKDNRNFMKYGMDSLRGMRFINLVQEEYQIKISAKTLIDNPTLNSFFKVISENLKSKSSLDTDISKVEHSNHKIDSGSDLEILLTQLQEGSISTSEALNI